MKVLLSIALAACITSQLVVADLSLCIRPNLDQFTGNREAVVKQIGNAVPPPMAEALCRAMLS